MLNKKKTYIEWVKTNELRSCNVHLNAYNFLNYFTQNKKFIVLMIYIFIIKTIIL